MKYANAYNTVIFDLDGTLIDSSPSILNCFGQVLNSAGLAPLVPLVSSLIGPPLRQTLINLTGITDSAVLDRLVDDFKECYDADGYKATLVYGGVDEMLAQLADSDITLAIATNKRRIPTLKIVEHLGWERYFLIVGTLDMPVPPHIDKAAMIRQVLNDIGAIAELSLYVGDKLEDGEAAQANHIRFIAAGWGYGEWDSVVMLNNWNYLASPIGLRKLLR